jgi:hypothetical protein
MLSPVAPTRSPDLRRALLRREVGRFRQRESRRVFDASVHVGVLDGPRTGFVVRAQDVPAVDAGLRLDVVARLLDDSPADWATAWLVRPGVPEPHDLDRQWLAAFRMAFALHDRELDGCYVVTRTGWRDLVTDEARTWVRLRL